MEGKGREILLILLEVVRHSGNGPLQGIALRRCSSSGEQEASAPPLLSWAGGGRKQRSPLARTGRTVICSFPPCTSYYELQSALGSFYPYYFFIGQEPQARYLL